MTLPTDSAAREAAARRDSTLAGTLPLIVLTSIFFAGSWLAYVWFPRVGPARFPLWGLLVILGFMAAIGAVVSWFFATDEGEVSTGSADGKAFFPPQPGSTTQGDFGRPAPGPITTPTRSEATGGAGPITGAPEGNLEPWDEDVLPPAAVHGPRPVLTTLDDPGSVGRALEEIADIQRQLLARRMATDGPSEPSALS